MIPVRLVGLLAAFALVGCQCQCSNVIVQSDGGTRDGGKGGSAGTGGGLAGGAGGEAGGDMGGGDGTGGGTGLFDAGDGTVIVNVDPGGLRLDAGTDGEGTGLSILPNPDGGLALNQSTTELYFMWIANAAQGTVSKYDTRTGKEVGRYFSVMPKDCANSVGPPCTSGNVTDLTSARATSWSPSRTAIDLHSDMWVANRAPGLQGSVTKIANDLTDCVDRNGNGRIDTSRDLDNDGAISTAADAGEMIIPTDPNDPTQYDECVLFTTPVGSINTDPMAADKVTGRGLAIGAGLEGSAGDIWVSIYHEGRMYKLHPRNGQVVPVGPDAGTFVQLPFPAGTGAYGAAVDRLQRLWCVLPGASVFAQIDATTGRVVRAPDGGSVFSAPDSYQCRSYGFAIDRKNRLWLPTWGGLPNVCRYDPATNVWDRFDITAARNAMGQPFGWGRGIAVSAPTPGHPDGVVYMSGWLDQQPNDPVRNANRAMLMRLDAADGGIIPYGTADYIEATDTNTWGSIGVGLDGQGQPWVNNYSGNAMKIDNATGAITRTAQQPAGLYTYSDFTGYQARTFTAPVGQFRKVFIANCDNPIWTELNFFAYRPANTSVQAFTRAADNIPALNMANRYGAFTVSPVDLTNVGLPRSKFLRVEFELRSQDGVNTPVLHNFSVKWRCPIEIN